MLVARIVSSVCFPLRMTFSPFIATGDREKRV
jgi:hypothetical protein